MCISFCHSELKIFQYLIPMSSLSSENRFEKIDFLLRQFTKTFQVIVASVSVYTNIAINACDCFQTKR